MSTPNEHLTDITPAHRWTHTGDRVLILKVVNADGTAYGGFRWPEKGPVTPDYYSRKPRCESGGLFGWAWGLCLGAGKEPNYQGRWIVFAAHPDDVIALDDGKVKAVPNPEQGRTPEVLYCGTWQQANQRILEGQIAWVKHAARGASSATGEGGASSATGYGGASSATGEGGASSATGYRGASSATGEGGASSATGEGGASSATGARGASSATGEGGASSATGDRGIAAVTGEAGTVEASATGIAVTTAHECWWRVIEGAVFVQRWAPDKLYVADAAGSGARTGDRLRIVRGEIVERVEAPRQGAANG